MMNINDDFGDLEQHTPKPKAHEIEYEHDRVSLDEIADAPENVGVNPVTRKPKKPDKHDYVNEHMLSVLMSMFRNWDGNAPKDIQFREDFKEARAKFNLALVGYTSLLASGCDKRQPRTQKAFMKMLVLSGSVYPNDKEIAELYNYIRLMCRGCLGTYARNRYLDLDDIVSSTFERWMKYCHNFDPLKRSQISGARVNAFAYMTQIIKNTIFETINKQNRQWEINETLKGEILLNESIEEVVTRPTELHDGDGDSGVVIDAIVSAAENMKPVWDAEIVRCLVERAHLFMDLKDLISNITREGYTEEEIFRTISTHDLLDPLSYIIRKNMWAF